MNNDNQVAVYTFDQSTQVLTGVRYEEQSYELKSNETLVAPQDGLRPPYTWNGTDWDQASVDEFNAQHPSMGPAVTPSTQALNLLGQQLTEATQNNDSFNEKLDELTSSVNMLGQMIAKATVAPASSSVDSAAPSSTVGSNGTAEPAPTTPSSSTAPTESVASVAPVESSAPVDSTEPAASTAPTESSTAESATAADSTAPAVSTESAETDSATGGN